MAAARGRWVAFSVQGSGRGAVWVDDGDGARPLPSPGVTTVTSHPALARRSVLVYATLEDGRGALVRLAGGGGVVLLAEGDRWGGGRVDGIGPLGPTVTAGGLGAFRATVDGHAAVGRVAEHPVRLVLPEAAEVDGLPVVRADGAVAVRVRAGGVDSVGLAGVDGWSPLVSAPGDLDALGRFPSADDRGRVAVPGERGGGSGAFRVDGPRRAVPLPVPGFQVRSVLLAARGPSLLTGTPPGGALEVHRAGRPPRRLLGLGDPVDGAPIVDLALNPASVDAEGGVAVRVGLADGREAVAHAPSR